MLLSVGERWTGAFDRLRLALEGENTAARILAESQARIGRARDALERTTPRPRCRPRPRPEEPAGAGLEPRSYFTLVFEPDGVVSLHRLWAGDDDEAASLARTLARGPADLWDGMRFIERFEPPAVSSS
ncbi:hypothetical protein [uncultured Methylobacterium sp.]|uniref:hypothetical protein n=1 Tax=uncultured Methylobacterium sp. TaxID=157278 RepID=UPI0035C9C161